MTKYRVRIEPDEEYAARPADFVSWSPTEDAEYVAQFERGEISAYGVIVERTCDMDEWHHAESVWGVDVYAANQEGTYDTPAALQDEYLREVAEELWVAALIEETPDNPAPTA